MIKSRYLRGSLILATAAAAALAACGNNDGSSGDGDGDTGGSSGDGDGDGDTGGSMGDGDGDTGGMGGGTTGSGGDTSMGGMPPTADELVDELCPSPADDYVIYEGSEGADTFPDVLGTVKTAIVTDGGDDTLGYVKYGTEEACFLAGDGNDTLTITGIGNGYNASENSSDVGVGYIVLGEGADTINYAVDANDWYFYRQAATVADFESGADKLRFELEANRLPSTTVASSVVFTSGFTSASVAPEATCEVARIFIDTDDGEVWLSKYCEGSRNYLLMTIEGDVPTAEDIEIYYRQEADTPAKAADQICSGTAASYSTIIEGTDMADNFDGYDASVTRLTLGYGDDDVFAYPSAEGGSVQGCMIGGTGADAFNVTASLTGLGQALLFGGEGADVFNYASGNDGTPTDGPGDRAAVIIRDFTSGVDQIRISQTATQLISTNVAESVIFSATNFTGATVQTYESCSDYKLIVDQTDGEVWLSRNYCENTDDHNMLLIRNLGDVPVAEDIVLY